MAFDRFVYWKDRVPSRTQVQHVLEDYVRDLALSVEWVDDQRRFYVRLPGMGSHPLARVGEHHLQAFWTEEARKSERHVEVYVSDDGLDVITRRADEVTNAVADGFARLCARFWQGRLEQG